MRLFLLVNMLRYCGLLRIAQTNGIAMGKSWSYIWLNAGLTTKVRV